MIRLQVTSGQRAGTELEIGEPITSIGRNADATLRLSDPGVWANHLRIRFDPVSLVYLLEADPQASVQIQGRGVAERGYRLQPGDLMEIGAASVLFSLSPTTQRTFNLRERLTWISIVLLVISQWALLVFVLP